jgi:hypothetical protein
VGGTRGKTVNAISWVCWNKPCHGLPLLEWRQGRIHARKGPYVQGHYGQFLAILAQARLKADYPLRVGEHVGTVADLIETEKLTCETNSELTFKLISLAHYLDLNETWENERGEQWSIPRLIQEEIVQPITHTAACGGTHRLFGLSYAVRQRQRSGEPIDGEYERAAKYLGQYHRYAFSLQNSDGSFSTEWFKRRGAEQDIDRRLKTTGHILEWLVFSLPEEKLHSPQTLKAVNYLSTIMLRNTEHAWELGPRGHALHALALYEQRIFRDPLRERAAEIARRERIQRGETSPAAESDDAESEDAQPNRDEPDDTEDDEAGPGETGLGAAGISEAGLGPVETRFRAPAASNAPGTSTKKPADLPSTGTSPSGPMLQLHLHSAGENPRNTGSEHGGFESDPPSDASEVYIRDFNHESTHADKTSAAATPQAVGKALQEAFFGGTILSGDRAPAAGPSEEDEATSPLRLRSRSARKRPVLQGPTLIGPQRQ